MPPRIREIGPGELVDEDGKPLRPRLEALSGVWVPPSTHLEVVRECKFTFVCYPVPESLNGGAENRLEADDLPPILKDAGWRKRKLPDADTLVEDFLALSDGTDDRDVKYFAKKYGPLWVCARHSHLWTPIHPSNLDLSNPDPNAFCLWLPRESVELFRTFAKRLKACLLITNCLAGSPPQRVSVDDWQSLLGQDWGKYISGLEVREQRDHIAAGMSGQIFQSVSPWVSWDRGPRPSLKLQTGLGFLGRVWLHAAQLVAGGVDLRTCSGCQCLYVRRGRKPHEGWNNFCDDCRGSEGSKISKRLHAQKRRREQREAKAPSSGTKTTKLKE